MIGFIIGEMASFWLMREKPLFKKGISYSIEEMNGLICTRSSLELIKMYQDHLPAREQHNGLFFRDMNLRQRDLFHENLRLYRVQPLADDHKHLVFLSTAYAAGMTAVSDTTASLMSPKASYVWEHSEEFSKASKALSRITHAAKATNNKKLVSDFIMNNFNDLYLIGSNISRCDSSQARYVETAAIVIRAVISTESFDEALRLTYDMSEGCPEMMSMVGGIASQIWGCPAELQKKTFEALNKISPNTLSAMKDAGMMHDSLMPTISRWRYIVKRLKG